MTKHTAFVTLLLFLLTCYVLPMNGILREAFDPITFALPTLGLAGLPDPWIVQINLSLLLALVIAYLAAGALTLVGLRLVRAYHWDEAMNWLDTLTSIKDLRSIDGLLDALLPLLCIVFIVAIPFWHTEHLVVLTGVTWYAIRRNRAFQPAHTYPQPWLEPVGPLPARRPEPVPSADEDAASEDSTATSDDSDSVRKTYSWTYGERTSNLSQPHSADLVLHLPRYRAFREKERELDVTRWDNYITATTPEVDELAGKLAAQGLDRGYRTYDSVGNVLSFTQQCILYDRDADPDTGEFIEYPKYPLESLMEEEGDCEDQAILSAALLKRMGYDVALLFCPGHAAVGVAGAEGLPGTYVSDPATQVHYFYAETTAQGWRLGELPDDLQVHLMRGEFDVVSVVMRVEDDREE